MNLMDYYLTKTFDEKQEAIPWGSLKYLVGTFSLSLSLALSPTHTHTHTRAHTHTHTHTYTHASSVRTTPHPSEEGTT